MKYTLLWMALLVAVTIDAQLPVSAEARPGVWLDSDTGNEMDDLFAIVRLLKEPSLTVLGLSSAHFNNADLLVFEQWNGYPARGLNTVAESQRLNEVLLVALNRSSLPHPLGADRQIGRAWGENTPRDSPAAQGIINAARSLPAGQRLDVLSIGAMTNVASAVILAPDIIPRIRVFSMGARYNPATKAWGKNEFNIRNDLNAFDYLLDCPELDLTMMPAETSRALQFARDDTYARLDANNPLEQLLANRWREHFKDSPTWIMWDLALVEAYLKPALAKVKTVRTPPENKRRSIRVYTNIDAARMAADFWAMLR